MKKITKVSLFAFSMLLSGCYQANAVVHNEEITILAKYIQTRNERIPSEIANIQARAIIEIAEQHDINHTIINGIIEEESTYNPKAVSKARAKGLMQVLREDGIKIDKRRVHNIQYNIDTGTRILKSKLKKSKGNLRKGLQYYSGKKKGYSTQVLNNIDRYKKFRREEIKNSTRIAMR